MVEIKGNILNASISILIDTGACRSYVSCKIVDECKLGKVKHEKPWLVQLAIGMKWKVSEIVKECEVNLNGFLTKVNLNGFLTKLNLNILYLGSYDILIN